MSSLNVNNQTTASIGTTSITLVSAIDPLTIAITAGSPLSIHLSPPSG